MSSKRYKKAIELIDTKQLHALNTAVDLLSKLPAVKFDETVELAAHLLVDPKREQVRGTVKLPHGSGKKVTILAFTEDTQAALDAGAEYAGLEDMIKKVQEGWLDFDVAVATPNAMKEVRNLARLLGPKGLMPNPKSGTVSEDLPSAIQAVKAGRVEFKMDKTANVSIVIGKRSFTSEHLEQNALQAISELLKARPESCKTQYLKSLTLSSSMSPGISLELKSHTN